MVSPSTNSIPRSEKQTESPRQTSRSHTVQRLTRQPVPPPGPPARPERLRHNRDHEGAVSGTCSPSHPTGGEKRKERGLGRATRLM